MSGNTSFKHFSVFLNQFLFRRTFETSVLEAVVLFQIKALFRKKPPPVEPSHQPTLVVRKPPAGPPTSRITTASELSFLPGSSHISRPGWKAVTYAGTFRRPTQHLSSLGFESVMLEIQSGVSPGIYNG